MLKIPQVLFSVFSCVSLSSCSLIHPKDMYYLIKCCLWLKRRICVFDGSLITACSLSLILTLLQKRRMHGVSTNVGWFCSENIYTSFLAKSKVQKQEVMCISNSGTRVLDLYVQSPSLWSSHAQNLCRVQLHIFQCSNMMWREVPEM